MSISRYLCFLLVSGVLLFSCTKDVKAPDGSPVQRNGALKVEGSKILNANNQPIQLTGMSLFWSQWQGQYYTPETVKWLASDWRCTVVRAAMGVDMGGYLTNAEAERQKVYTVIDAALEAGIYVIVDWHDHHGENHLEQAKEFFSEVSDKYGDHPNIIYEIYNEPLGVSWSKVLKPYCTEVIKVIRENDPDNLIICGTPSWSQRVDEAALDPIKLPNIAYALHFYAATHKQDLRDIAKTAIDKELPLFVTEFGTTEASGNGELNEAETRLWWAFLDEHKISWCNWSIADKKETASALKKKTDPMGNWKNTDLTRSGKLIRSELQKRNP